MNKNTLNQNHLNIQQNKTNCERHNHKFKLQQDGHYICKNCNLIIESPEFCDSKILSFTDYLKVFSLQLLFAYFEILIPSRKEKNQLQNTVNKLISNIRKKPQYSDKYSRYTYQENLTNEENVNGNLVEMQSVNFKVVLEISTKLPIFNSYISGFYALKSLKIQSELLDTISQQNNCIDLAELISNTNNLTPISTAISRSKEIISFDDKSDIFIGDYLVKIKVRSYYLEFYYSETGELKSVFIEKT